MTLKELKHYLRSLSLACRRCLWLYQKLRQPRNIYRDPPRRSNLLSQHQYLFGIIYRPGLKAIEKALTEEQVTSGRADATFDVLNYQLVHRQRSNSKRRRRHTGAICKLVGLPVPLRKFVLKILGPLRKFCTSGSTRSRYSLVPAHV